MKNSLIISLLIFFTSSYAISSDLLSHKNNLTLKNKYTFTYYWFKVYTVKLYMDKNEKTQNVLQDVDKILEFTYHRDIEGKVLVEKGNDSLKRNPEFSFEKYQKELKLINTNYSDVSEGDKYILDYNKDLGLTLFEKRADSNQAKKLVVIKNKKFSKFYLGIWLSKYALGKGVYNELVNS